MGQSVGGWTWVQAASSDPMDGAESVERGIRLKSSG